MSNNNQIDIEVRAKAILGDAQKQISGFLKDLETSSQRTERAGTVSMSQLQNAFRKV